MEKKEGFLESLFNSFKNNQEGYSGRKLSAFDCIGMANIITFVACYICVKNKDAEPLKFFVVVYILGALVFLGMVTIPQLIMALKTIKGDNSTTIIEEEKSTETTIQQTNKSE